MSSAEGCGESCGKSRGVRYEYTKRTAEGFKPGEERRWRNGWGDPEQQGSSKSHEHRGSVASRNRKGRRCWEKKGGKNGQTTLAVPMACISKWRNRRDTIQPEVRRNSSHERGTSSQGRITTWRKPRLSRKNCHEHIRRKVSGTG